MNPQQPASSPADLLHTDLLHAEAREVLRRLTGVANAEFHDDQYEAIRAPWPTAPAPSWCSVPAG